MKNILLTFEYDGTKYSGWLIQKNAVTIQGVVQAALSNLLGSPISINGCSRTDSGVHAINYLASFKCETTIPPNKICYALNDYLPNEIVCKASELVPDEFHARFDSTGKIYKYLLYNSTFPSPLLANRAWYNKRSLNVELMQSAATHFIGKHDFSAFRAVGGLSKTTERTIFNTSVSQDSTGMITFEVEGDGFLYNMVRIMAGTLAYVGQGKIPPTLISDIISSKDRKKAGITAPAHGLYLSKVLYLTSKL